MQQFLIYGAGLLSLLNLLNTAWKVWTKRTDPSNTATWSMWALLDLVILLCTIAAQKEYMLPLSYTVGASAVAIVHIFRGKWAWGKIEKQCIAGAVISTILWLAFTPEVGIFFGVIAMTVAGWPLLLDIKNKRNPKMVWLFALTAIACLMTLLGTPWPWDIGSALLGAAGMIYNGTVAWFCVRMTGQAGAKQQGLILQNSE